jgi:hypothetical protein
MTGWKNLFGLYADYRKWEIAIEDWQQPVLKDEKLPEWYALSLLWLLEAHCNEHSLSSVLLEALI